MSVFNYFSEFIKNKCENSPDIRHVIPRSVLCYWTGCFSIDAICYILFELIENINILFGDVIIIIYPLLFHHQSIEMWLTLVGFYINTRVLMNLVLSLYRYRDQTDNIVMRYIFAIFLFSSILLAFIENGLVLLFYLRYR